MTATDDVTATVRCFLSPESIAIVGISGGDVGTFRPGGRAVFDHLRKFGFAGALMPVNPRYEAIDGVTCFPSITDLPTIPDCLVVAVPASSVVQVIRDAAARGIRRALLLTAGFSELGPDGAELQRSVDQLAHDAGIRLVGPNSTGIANIVDSIYLTMTSVMAAGGGLTAGSTALLLQSGALGSCVIDRARRNQVGVGYVVSLGNQADLDAADFLEYFAEDDRIEAVSLYAEGVRDGPRYRAAIENLIAGGKRLFVLPGGTTELGERAAVTHSGRLAGRAVLERALLSSSGATIIEDPDDLWRAPALYTRYAHRVDRGRIRVGVFTISGGLAVMTADRLSTSGEFDLPFPTADTGAALKAHLPDYLGANNPLDLGPGPMPHGFGPALEAFAADPQFDAVVVALPVVATAWQDTVVDAIVSLGRSSDRAVVVAWHAGDSCAAAIARLRASSVVVVESPTDLPDVLRAVKAVGWRGAEGASSSGDEASSTAPSAAGNPNDFDTLRAIAAAGGDIAPMELVSEPTLLTAAAERVGYPLVLKALIPGVAHKTEHGLVTANLRNATALEAAADRLLAAAARLGATRSDLLVQAMAAPGVEIILSVRRDSQLGDFVGVGLGGTLTELLGDVAYTPYPLTDGALDRLLDGLAGRPLIDGYRGRPGVDRTWIKKSLIAVIDAMHALGACEIEVNPALARADGGTMVDALASLPHDG